MGCFQRCEAREASKNRFVWSGCRERGRDLPRVRQKAQKPKQRGVKCSRGHMPWSERVNSSRKSLRELARCLERKVTFYVNHAQKFRTSLSKEPMLLATSFNSAWVEVYWDIILRIHCMKKRMDHTIVFMISVNLEFCTLLFVHDKDGWGSSPSEQQSVLSSVW